MPNHNILHRGGKLKVSNCLIRELYTNLQVHIDLWRNGSTVSLMQATFRGRVGETAATAFRGSAKIAAIDSPVVVLHLFIGCNWSQLICRSNSQKCLSPLIRTTNFWLLIWILIPKFTCFTYQIQLPMSKISQIMQK